jgi:SAM-dependent methyltransferase
MNIAWAKRALRRVPGVDRILSRRRPGSVEPAYFDALYAGDPDPWKYTTSDYEREKYAATIAALPGRRFKHGLEIGCSIGILTRELAKHCDAMLGIDVAEAALAQARVNTPAVRFERRMVPGEWPPGEFDLMLFSEVLYYLDAPAIRQTASRSRACLSPGGSILLVHFTEETGAPVTGDEAATIFIAATGLTPAYQLRAARYRIDRLDAPPAAMPAK